MSCYFFGAESLGNIVKVLVAADQFEPEKTRERVCAGLAIISQANAAAFKHRYDQEATPIPSETILERSLAPNKAPQLNDAVRDAGLLHYNCDEDRDWLEATPGGMLALSLILNKLLFAQQDALEHAQKLVKAYSPGP